MLCSACKRIPSPRLSALPKLRSLSSSHNVSLAFEWIVEGRVLTVAENVEVNDKYGDRDTVVFLHGLLGNGKVRYLNYLQLY